MRTFMQVLRGQGRMVEITGYDMDRADGNRAQFTGKVLRSWLQRANNGITDFTARDVTAWTQLDLSTIVARDPLRQFRIISGVGRGPDLCVTIKQVYDRLINGSAIENFEAIVFHVEQVLN